LKITAKDARLTYTDVTNPENLIRLIQSAPSLKTKLPRINVGGRPEHKAASKAGGGIAK
jgi:hypothetical protein